ncbi:MAG: YihY/virulence factor BrkB family protein [Candidatus Eremiobacteraeota bacterium]|nr:YihY/virulence factor BrkB family protein [Candidatus Eremiobacteraeota bacterium]
MTGYRQLLQETYSEWSSNKAPRLAAALSYYTLFAMAPLLVIVIQIGAMIIGGGRAAGHHRQITTVLEQILQSSLGPATAKTVGELVEATVSQQGQGLFSAALGWIMLLVAAVGLFGALKDALNTIWELPPPPPRSWPERIRERFTAFSLIAGLAVLLLVSLASNTVLALLPLDHTLLQVVNLAVIFGLATLLFAFIFKYLPDLRIRWSDVWVGSLVTTALSALGQVLLSLYLTRMATSSTFGAAGSLVILMVWVYYQAQILLFGATFTRVYANRLGSYQ